MNFIKIVKIFGQMSQEGEGDLGCAKSIGAPFLDFYHFRISKSAGRKNSVQSLIYFQRPEKRNFMLFCRILKNVAIYV